MDIKNIKEVLKLSIDGVKLGVQIKKDGKVGLNDVPLAFQILQDFPAAIDGIDQVPAELKDLDAAEGKELVDFIIAELGVDDAKAELIINKAFSALIANVELVKAIKS